MGSLGDSLRFDHVEMYVDTLRELSWYKQLETQFAQFVEPSSTDGDAVAAARKQWAEVAAKTAPSIPVLDSAAYSPVGQDPVEQLIAGFGWRITQAHLDKDASTHSVVLTSSDSAGAAFVVTTRNAVTPPTEADGPVTKRARPDAASETYPHFAAAHIDRYYDAHAGRQGLAVLSFETQVPDGVTEIFNKYKALYPGQLVHDKVFTFGDGDDQTLLCEVYAYRSADLSAADPGTVLRFVERRGAHTRAASVPLLPGLTPVEATFDAHGKKFPCYSDHWVSNVIDRKDFLHMLNQTLGFTPKVDFNAGVVGAGEAVIESTVTGNQPESSKRMTKQEVLINQQQVYLPTNNALSGHGHVHLFIEQVGQGLQHIASRVIDLVGFIRHGNAVREVTGRGFRFLRIPSSYYGRLSVGALASEGRVGEGAATAVFDALCQSNLVSAAGAVNLDITDEAITTALGSINAEFASEALEHIATLIATVKKARYSNLYTLLRDHLSEASYLDIVRNQILVDIQGQDILYQIFTANVMQRKEGEEAPFFEFIQRVCSEQADSCGQPVPVRPGCGGFGIRNFLTLFLSIEVSKAMLQLEQAQASGDVKAAAFAQKVIDIFTEQLEESNPILTAISDAMTAEADALLAAEVATDPAQREALLAVAKEHAQKKLEGQENLKICGEKHKAAMRLHRQA
eukprot:m.87424 g.87424  ORF g.87424 m.87424 type:complete len:683 (-) comp14908_c0_seq2:61-2109(-)